MIKKLRINEANEKFDKEELWSFLSDCIEDTVYSLLDSKLSVNALKAEVPGYDKDWCAEEMSKANSKKIDDIILKLTDIVYDMSMENYKE